MALGIPTNTNRTPIVKYDARAGRWFRVDGKDSVVDISNGFTAVFDLAQIDIGWALFAAGAPPSTSFARVPAQMPPQPSPDHKRSVRLMLKLSKSAGGDVRELLTQAGIVMAAIDQLHDAYMAAPEAREGKLPVVACPSTEAVTQAMSGGAKSTNYKPVPQIVNWVPRPADLPLTSGPTPVAVAAPAPVVAPPATGAKVATPPVAKPAAAPAVTDDTDDTEF
jgi:hypothetical protein